MDSLGGGPRNDAPYEDEATAADVVVVGDLSSSPTAKSQRVKEWVSSSGRVRIGVRFPRLDANASEGRSVERMPCYIVPVDARVARAIAPVAIVGDQAWIPLGRMSGAGGGRRTGGGPFLPTYWAALRGSYPGMTVVDLRYPSGDKRDVNALLRPLIENILVRRLEDDPDWRAIRKLYDIAEEVYADLFEQFTKVVPAFVEGVTGAFPHWTRPWPEDEAAYLMPLLAEFDLKVTFTLEPYMHGAGAVQSMGAGGGRASQIALLELYLDPDLWPPEDPLTILLEEPELGLHPRAQRRMANALKRLRGRSGIQVVATTHSPILIDAAGLDGVRVVRAVEGPDAIVRPSELSEIRDALGPHPSDALLGKCS